MGVSELSQKEAIDILNKWGDDGFFRLNQYGSLIHIDRIAPLTSVFCSVQTQYESRDISAESIPYSGGHVDSGYSPKMWDIEVESPKDFENSKKELQVPGSEKVVNCSKCSGRGKNSCSSCSGNGEVRCSTCGGDGKTNCSYCSGRGQVNCSSCSGHGYNVEYKSKTESYYDYSKGSTEWRTVNYTENVRCYSCSSGKVSCTNCSTRGKVSCWTCHEKGKVTCSRCNGSGTLTCGDCSGNGRIKTYKILKVKFNHKGYDSFINPSDIPNKKLTQVLGEVFVDERKEKITDVASLLILHAKLLRQAGVKTETTSLALVKCPECGEELSQSGTEPMCSKCEHSWPESSETLAVVKLHGATLKDEVVRSVAELFRQCEPKNERVLFQRLVIQGVDSYKIEYTKDGVVGKPIWIYGKENRVHSIGMPPLDWHKVGIAGAIVVMLLILLIMVINSM